MSVSDQHVVGGVTCLLCNATISVRLGNFQKLNSHLEVNHDVFFQQDLLMALNFLEDHERDVIIEKVLPRMKLTLNNAKNLYKKDVLKKKLDIEKRIFGDAAYKENYVSDKDDDGSNTSSRESREDDSIDFDDVVEDNCADEEEEVESPTKKVKLEELPTEVLDEDALEISLNESDEVFMGGDENMENKESSNVNLNSSNPNSAPLGKDEVICNICQNRFKKKSMYNHVKRCELRERVRLMGEEKKKNESINADNNDEVTSKADDEDDRLIINEETEPEINDPSKLLINMTTCKACDKTFSSRGNLKRHQRQNPSHVDK